jgi:hypothetical protein
MTYAYLRRGMLAAMAAALIVLGLTACGSSATTSTSRQATSGTTSASPARFSSAARQKLVTCLKAHGVTLPARRAGASGRAPGAGGYGGGPGFFSGPAGRRPVVSAKLRAAFAACGRSFPARRRFALNHAAVQRFSACVKQHGFTLPAPNFSGAGPVFPRNVETKPAFQAAARSCSGLLRGAAAPGGAPPTPATGSNGV